MLEKAKIVNKTKKVCVKDTQLIMDDHISGGHLKHNRSMPANDEKWGQSRVGHLLKETQKNTNVERCSRQEDYFYHGDGPVSGISSSITNHKKTRHAMSPSGHDLQVQQVLSVFHSYWKCGFSDTRKNMKQETLSTVEFRSRRHITVYET